MSTAISHDVHVTAVPAFEADHSDTRAGRFLFSYRITITNHGRETVKLLRRHWVITDSLDTTKDVEGPGVVGAMPILPPGETFEYTSACDLRSSIGRMRGTYLMERATDGQRFRVNVPEMLLVLPQQLN
jgi:ApaG protein